MEKKEKYHRIITGGIVAAIVFFAIAGVTLFGDDKSLEGDYSDTIAIIVSVFLSIWCVYIDYRIQLDNVRRITRSIFFVGGGWILMRYLKRLLIFSPVVSRYLTYLYSAPMLVISLLYFVLFFEIFFGNFKQKKAIYWTVLSACLLLFIAVLTNDVHSGYIYFPRGNENVAYYVYRPLYYVMIMYCYALIFLAMVLFVVGTAKRNGYAKMVSPIIVGTGLFLYYVLYVSAYQVIENIPLANDSVTVTLLFAAGILEVCMQCGLIQNSGKYTEYLSKSMVSLCITDDANRIIYKTRDFNERELNGKRDPDIVFYEKDISGGKVVIREDLRKINRLRRQSEKQYVRLKRSNDLLARSRAIREEESALRARRALYDEIENAVSKKMREVEALAEKLPDELTAENRAQVKKLLSEIKLRIGYLKQKSMLVLLAKTDDVLPEAQFRMMADVIKADVRSVGDFTVAFTIICGRTVPVTFALAFNDFVENIAERFAFSHAAIFVTANSEKNFCVASIESEKSIGDDSVIPSDYGYEILTTSEDGEYRITMRKEARV